MNSNEMTNRLEKYMDNGFYRTNQILVDFDGYGEDDAFFVDTFSTDLVGWNLNDYSAEYQYAFKYNQAAMQNERHDPFTTYTDSFFPDENEDGA